MIDDTIIEKPFSKTNECVYWQYSSKNADFSTGISLAQKHYVYACIYALILLERENKAHKRFEIKL